MDRKAKIGFVGVGNMGQCAHLRHYASLKECEVVALAEIRPNLARKVAARYGVPHVYTSADEMFANETLDGVVAPQPFTRHGLTLPDLYQHGLPVLSEKPLAGSVEVGEKLLATLQAGGSWHMVGYHKRSDPATMLARREIQRFKQTGELGKMRYVRIAMPPGDWIAGGFDELITDDYPQKADAEGTAALDYDPPARDMDAATFKLYVQFVNYYIHQVNLMRYLMGEPYRVTYASPSGVLLGVESESGVAGLLEMAAYSTTLDWQESALVAFEHGYIKLDLPAPLACNRPGRVELFSDAHKGTDQKVEIPSLPPVGAMRQQAANFVRAIKGEGEPPCQAGEALEDLRVARDYLRLWRGV
jgi:predicted dehydrogenase